MKLKVIKEISLFSFLLVFFLILQHFRKIGKEKRNRMEENKKGFNSNNM